MNIFALSDQPRTAARFHCDKHVVKMPLETAQLLCTAHRILDGADAQAELYKATHVNHPCAIWVRASMGNYIWTYMLFDALGKEYQHRYGKTHKSWRDLRGPLAKVPENIPQNGRTPFALAMPECYRHADPVEAYRAYYRQDKAHLHAWRNRDVPEWLNG